MYSFVLRLNKAFHSFYLYSHLVCLTGPLFIPMFWYVNCVIAKGNASNSSLLSLLSFSWFTFVLYSSWLNVSNLPDHTVSRFSFTYKVEYTVSHYLSSSMFPLTNWKVYIAVYQVTKLKLTLNVFKEMHQTSGFHKHKDLAKDNLQKGFSKIF